MDRAMLGRGADGAGRRGASVGLRFCFQVGSFICFSLKQLTSVCMKHRIMDIRRVAENNKIPSSQGRRDSQPGSSLTAVSQLKTRIGRA